MGILHEIVHVIKVGNWKYKECENKGDAERLVSRLSGSVTKIRIEAERRERE